MSRRIAQGLEAFLLPDACSAVEHDSPVGQPSTVARQRLTRHRIHADALEQLAAHASWFEIHQCGCPHVEGKTAATEKSGTAAGLSVSFQDYGGQALRLEPRGRRHSRNSASDDSDIVHIGLPVRRKPQETN